MTERNSEISGSVAMTPASFQPSQVAPLLPQTAPIPKTARHIRFLTGWLLFWLLPHRYGPYLAVMSFWRALIAYAFSAVIAAFIVAIGWALYSHGISASAFNKLRISTADVVVHLAAAQSQIGWMANPIIILVVLFLLPQIVLAILAIVLMPWCAGGDRAWSVFKRSLKNAYWSTTLLIPLSLIAAVLTLTFKTWSPWLRRDIPLIAATLVTFAVVALVTLRALLGGASRYVGEAKGPAFRPREPLCDECGYRIVGLPLLANCPECGTPVCDSLPRGRRKPTPWQQRFGLGRVSALIQMQFRVLFDANFFKKIPVHEGLGVARSFCLATVLLMLLVSLALLKIGSTWVDRNRAIGTLMLAGVTIVAIALIMHPLMMFVACLWGQFRCGVRDYRISASTCYYASPLMWPMMLITLCMSAFAMTPMAHEFFWKTYNPTKNFSIDGSSIFVLTCLGLSTLAALFWFRRLLAALQAVRYANV